jgi:hypothetical protein
MMQGHGYVYYDYDSDCLGLQSGQWIKRPSTTSREDFMSRIIPSTAPPPAGAAQSLLATPTPAAAPAQSRAWVRDQILHYRITKPDVLAWLHAKFPGYNPANDPFRVEVGRCRL